MRMMSSDDLNLDNLNPAEIDELLSLLESQDEAIKYNKMSTVFPEDGPYSRDKYKAHIKFINGSKDHSQLAFIAANRTGKTFTGAYIMACHLTGLYPDWWEGRKYNSPVNAWAAGINNQTTKDVIQNELLGPVNDLGSGMIPRHLIVGKPLRKPGAGEALEVVRVRHATGGISELAFKSYEQGREAFQGTKKQVIWLDEEPSDESIYSECLMRLMDAHRPGIIYCTFTPLFGFKGIAKKFLPNLQSRADGSVKDEPDLFAIQTSWDDVPHLTEADKERGLKGALPYEREARSKGIPSLGSGVIYPFMDQKITCDPFPIPAWWPKAYGLDTGWNKTAAVFGAIDPDSGVVYVYNEYVAGQSHPAIHAHAIRQRGSYLIGAADAFGVNGEDGRKMLDVYLAEGLNLVKADKRSTDTGILIVSQMFEADRLKIFNTCLNTLEERRSYHRDKDGKIVKQDDHAMDALRYLCQVGLNYAETPSSGNIGSDDDYLGSRDRYTGY